MSAHRGIACAAGVVLALTAFTACGADATVVAPVQTEGTGPAATVLAVVGGEQAGCVTERRTVETALDAYYALNGADPATLDDLVPDFMRESPAARWSLAADPAGGAPTLTGVGVCEGA